MCQDDAELTGVKTVPFFVPLSVALIAVAKKVPAFRRLVRRVGYQLKSDVGANQTGAQQLPRQLYRGNPVPYTNANFIFAGCQGSVKNDSPSFDSS
jgi:hypothetical protein